MKRRLFWKILLGFWLTFMIITNGIWLLFSLLPSPDMQTYARDTARMSVDAASSIIRLSGEKSFEAQLANWPWDPRHRIQVRPASAPLDPRTPLETATVLAPDGSLYRVSYFPRQRRPVSLLGIPRVTAIVAAIGGLFFSAILAWYLTRPIHRIREGFGRLAQGDFTTRLGPAMGRRRDEIADLARDFDTMAVRLKELVGARDRLLADVSHELRTPLARLNLAIGLVRQDPAKLSILLDRIGGEAKKLDEMVGELLTLAKLESNQGQGEDYFNFAEIVKQVVDDARYEAAAKSIEVKLTIEPVDENFEWLAAGSGRLVSRAAENILRNALRYSPEGGRVTVGLRRRNGKFDLSVIDDGPGIPQEALGNLFQPFGVSADGFGFGLGLAIAQRAITVHGGSISAKNRSPHGLEMAVNIPAAALQAV
ncbi:MAG: HAMP domain-containing sensor histidine kinase [Rhizomicrobium sp.]